MPEVVVPGEYKVEFDTGLIVPAEPRLSPNRDERPAGASVSLIVLHGISLPPGKFGGESVDALFMNTLDWGAHPYFDQIRDLRVSAHLFLRRDGRLLQYVPLHARAWHAGKSRHRGRDRCNDYSIGIELEGDDETPYDERQYAVLTPVIHALRAAYPTIGIDDVVGHCDVAPGRKTDPGPAFDWQRLYDALAVTHVSP
jgi:AmpD protein